MTGPTTAYSDLVAPFILSGVGMALFFAPVANVVLSSVRPEQEGKASGANNAIRELGGVFGVAVLASIFAHAGGYRTALTFSHGTTTAVYVGAAVVALGALASALIKPPRAARACRAAGAHGGRRVASRTRGTCDGILRGMPSLRRRAVLAASHVPYVYGLTKLGRVFGTDKVDACRTRTTASRTRTSTSAISARGAGGASRSLELGVWRGDSLRMWNALLPSRRRSSGSTSSRRAAERAAGFEVAIGSSGRSRRPRRHPARGIADVRLVVDDASHITSLDDRVLPALVPPPLARAASTSWKTSRRTRTSDWPGHHARAGRRLSPARSSRTPARPFFNRRQDDGRVPAGACPRLRPRRGAVRRGARARTRSRSSHSGPVDRHRRPRVTAFRPA